MPTLSFVLSALLVSSGAMYTYLSSTDKIEKTKQKIVESNKVEFLSKKTSLKLASSLNSDVDQSISVVSLDDSKISETVAMDDSINIKDTRSLDRLQKAMQKVVLEDGIDNPTCIELADTGFVGEAECEKLEDKQFSFYNTTTADIQLPSESILAKDSVRSSRLEKRMASANNSDKLVKKSLTRHKKVLKDEKILEKIISKSTDSDYLMKVASKYMDSSKKTKQSKKISSALQKSILKNGSQNCEVTNMLDKINQKEEKSNSDKFKKELAQLDKQKQDLLKQKKSTLSDIRTLEDKIERYSIFGALIYGNSLEDKQEKLTYIDKKINYIVSSINKLKEQEG